MKQKEGVDNHRSLLTWRFGLQVAAILIILAGASAAPTTAQAAERYWVGGTGSWSDTTKWATATGGATTGSVPTSADNAHFNADSNTTAYTVTVDATANMNDLMFDAAPFVSGL